LSRCFTAFTWQPFSGTSSKSPTPRKEFEGDSVYVKPVVLGARDEASRDVSPRYPDAMLPAPRDIYVDTTDGRFHCLDWGGGANDARPALLLLHGFNQTAHSWDEVAPRLAEAYRVVAIDQRGHGETNAGGGDYGREAMAGDVANIAGALGIAAFALTGMSMGAVHAIVCATRAPHVRCLAIVDYAPEIEARGVSAIRAMCARSWATFEDAVLDMHRFNPRRTLDNIRQRLRHSLRQAPDGSWRWRVDPALAENERFHDSADVMWRFVESVPCPTLMIRGAESDILSDAAAGEMVRRLRRPEAVTVAGAGHTVAGDQPDAFCDAMLPFLDRHARAASTAS
jgi:pimeloyl-ACP methyl ester carboxylesterase